MRKLTMELTNCEGCPFCRLATFDRKHIHVCGNEEAAKRRGGDIQLQFISLGIPNWCPLPFMDAQEKQNNSILYAEA